MTIDSMIKSKVKFKISLKLYENENTTYLNIQNLMKTALRRNFLTLVPERKCMRDLRLIMIKPKVFKTF